MLAKKTRSERATAMRFVLLLGFVSLFADVTYEGARGIFGQYMAQLGANATVVALVAGFGEFIGYAGRLVFGWISDRTKHYWTSTIIGYLLNLVTVPLLALAKIWPVAAFLMMSERLGKAIRTPARDAMLSYATKEVGRGWGFGLHMALDQLGGLLGPLLMTGILFYQHSYPLGFAVLAVPAGIALVLLLIAQRQYPAPQKMEVAVPVPEIEIKGFSKQFWIYVAAVSFMAAGYVDFPLIAYHFKQEALIPEVWIPLYYTLALGSGALSALIFGRLYDRLGILVFMGVMVFVSASTPLLFMDGIVWAAVGAVFWGMGLGAQGSIMRAAVANYVPKQKRATAYGVLNSCFGICWFAGSVVMGLLYDISYPLLVLFSVVLQLLSIPFLLRLTKTI